MARVIVCGSMVMDVAAFGKLLPRRGETVKADKSHTAPGGKGLNQGVAAVEAGADTVFFGAVGHDAFGEQLTGALTERGVDAHIKVLPGMDSGIALIIVGDGDNQIAVVPNANNQLNPESFEGFTFNKDDILVSQFETPTKTTIEFFKKGREVGATTILNPAPAGKLPKQLISLIDILVVNETELEVISGQKFDEEDTDAIITAAHTLTDRIGKVIVTRGSRGATYISNSEHQTIPGQRVDVVDTTGAGDCFVGNLAAALAEGKDDFQAIEWANSAAGICVTREGTSIAMPSRQETLFLG